MKVTKRNKLKQDHAEFVELDGMVQKLRLISKIELGSNRWHNELILGARAFIKSYDG